MKNRGLYTKGDIKFNTLISLIVLAIYSLNRFYIRNIINYNTLVGGFIAFHLNDFLCGIFFLAVYSLLIKKRIEKFRVCMLFIFICAIFWEFIIPFFRVDSYRDWKDVIAYLCGGAAYCGIMKLCDYRMNLKSVKKEQSFDCS